MKNSRSPCECVTNKQEQQIHTSTTKVRLIRPPVDCESLQRSFTAIAELLLYVHGAMFLTNWILSNNFNETISPVMSAKLQICDYDRSNAVHRYDWWPYVNYCMIS